MAKYTELFSEYLEGGGGLPASFAQISGFTDIFKAYYYDAEIGAETETLFAIKLEARARLKIPAYKKRIDLLAAMYTGIGSNPTKVYYEHTEGSVDTGAQKGKTTELPVNAATAAPNSIIESDAYTNEDERETTRNEMGYTMLEGYQAINELNKKVTDLVEQLLNEFRCCFMEIF